MVSHAPGLNHKILRGAVKAHMRRNGISLRAFSKRAGLDVSNVSKYVRGLRGMSPQGVVKLSAAMDIDPLTFYTDDEDTL